MTEKLFQFIWQFRYFNAANLRTTSGEELQIIHPGTHNKSQGPDFLNGKIRCGDTFFAGHIELHIKSSDWLLHKHSNDLNYQNVILHVVWLNDKELPLNIPVLEMYSRVSNVFLQKYESLMQAGMFIPCEKHIVSPDDLAFNGWKERLFTERLEEKAAGLKPDLQRTNYHWEEVFLIRLAGNFGMKVNRESFENILRSLPMSLLAKHTSSLIQLESLLLGQAGLLHEDFEDPYPRMLSREYAFLRKKYKLIAAVVPVHFLRMRPANFPTIRLAQFAALLHRDIHLFAKIKDVSSLKEIRELFEAVANDFWHYHYTLHDSAAFAEKHLGKSMIDNLILNTVLPVLYAYSCYNNLFALKEKISDWCVQLPPEKNNITYGFINLGFPIKNALDSQAFIQLKNTYCDEKRCLQCVRGSGILKG